MLRLEADGRLVEHGDLKPTATFHGNDMVVDAAGRAYVGNFGFDLDRFIEERGYAALWAARDRRPPRWSGSTRTARPTWPPTDLSFPNGTVVTPDGRTLIVAETLAGRLTAFDVGHDGTLNGRRVWAELPWCSPDGICLDAEGRVWVANAMSSECLLVAEGGDDRQPGRHLPDLLRLHAGGCGPPHPVPDHRADQHRVGGRAVTVGTDRAGPGRGGRGRPALTVPMESRGQPWLGEAGWFSAAGSGTGAGCARPGRCAARSR